MPAVPDVICFGRAVCTRVPECCGCGTYRSIRASGLIAFDFLECEERLDLRLLCPSFLLELLSSLATSLPNGGDGGG